MNATDITYMNQELVNGAVRGFVMLPTGEVGVVCDGGRTLVAKSPRLLSAFQSERLLEGRARALTEEEASLAALDNLTGPSAGERLSARREAREPLPTPRGVHETRPTRRSVDLTRFNADSDEFMPDSEFVGRPSDSDRQKRTARDERLRAEVPNV